MDPTGNSTINVTSTTTPISIPAGEFRIFGNAASEVLSAETPSQSLVMMLPNPAKETIQFNRNLKDIEIFDISGKSVLKHSKRTTKEVNILISDHSIQAFTWSKSKQILVKQPI